MIKGWDEGLVGMKVGGERTLEVPPQLGYGKRKSGDIPANSTLFFGKLFQLLIVLVVCHVKEHLTDSELSFCHGRFVSEVKLLDIGK